MSGNENILPQTGRGIDPESRGMVTTMSSPMDSGGANSQAYPTQYEKTDSDMEVDPSSNQSTQPTPLVGNDCTFTMSAQSTSNEMQWNQNISIDVGASLDFLTRSRRISRSPHKERSSSLPALDKSTAAMLLRGNRANESTKRKAEDPLERHGDADTIGGSEKKIATEEMGSFIDGKAETLSRTLLRMMDEVNKLQQAIAPPFKPKREIRECYNIMSDLKKVIEEVHIIDWLKTAKSAAQIEEESKENNQDLRAEEITIPDDGSYVQFRQIRNTYWSSKSYKITKLEELNPFETENNRNLLLLVDKKAIASHAVKTLVDNRTGMKDTMDKLKLKEGKITTLKTSNTIMMERDEENEKLECNSALHLLYLGDIEVNGAAADLTEEVIFEEFKNKKNNINEMTHKLVLAPLINLEPTRLRKLAEFTLGGRTDDIIIATRKNQLKTLAKIVSEGNSQTPTAGGSKMKQKQQSSQNKTPRKQKQNKSWNTVNVMISDKTSEHSYAQVVSKMKNSVDIEEVGVVVKSIQKSKSGNVRLTIKETKTGAVANLRAKVNEILEGEAKMIDPGDMKQVIVIRDMDTATTALEVEEAVKKAIVSEEGKNSVKLHTLKANYRGSSKTATVGLKKDDAAKLIKDGKLRIGWVICRVHEIITPTRCFKCYGHGHVAKDCTVSESDLNNCVKCNQSGHIAKDCTHEPFCLLQCNCDTSADSQRLVLRAAQEHDLDLAIVSEPNIKFTKNNQWFYNESCSVAIRVLNARTQVQKQGSGDCFVWVETGDLTIYGCYYSPNKLSLTDFEDHLNALKVSILSHQSKTHLVIGGDFNSKSSLWGSPFDCQRGIMLAEWMAELELEVLNDGLKPTFIRNNSSSFIDITMCSSNTFEHVTHWEVLDDECLSPHQFIMFEIDMRHSSPEPQGRSTTKSRGWRTNECKYEEFKRRLIQELENKPTAAEVCLETLTKTCDEIFTRKSSQHPNRKAVYWWTRNIAELRQKCIRNKRKLCRANACSRVSESERETIAQTYKANRKELRAAIRKSIEDKWRELCEQIDDNTWGEAYKIVTGKLRLQPKLSLSLSQKKKIVEDLFPRHNNTAWVTPNVLEGEIPLFTLDELVEAVDKMKPGKAPGPDGLPTEVIKLLVLSAPSYCLDMFNALLKNGQIPTTWKVARLVLLEKPKKSPNDEVSYRPLCLLNQLGKLMEHLLRARLEKEIEDRGGLSSRQYGFRKGKSTIDAVHRVMEIAAGAKARNEACVMVALDIRNAFNSVSWAGVLRELEMRQVSPYLLRMMQNYFTDRYIVIDDSDMQRGTRTGDGGEEEEDATHSENMVQLNSGVPQGSVVAPLLWNLYYDPLLKLNVPEKTELVAYADDLVMLVSGTSNQVLKSKIESTAVILKHWLEERMLQLAPQKTEAIMLVNKRSLPGLSIDIGGTMVSTSSSLKYLGVTLATNMRMTKHVIAVADKAERTALALGRLMRNVGGPSNRKREVLAHVVYSTLLYGAPIWNRACATAKQKYGEKVQRKIMIKICRAYRTTSTAALQVLSKHPPIELLVEERAKLYYNHEQANMSKQELKRLLREEVIEKWQEKWDQNYDTGQWTRRLIPYIKPWVLRQHGDLTYRTAQALTGHGSFGTFLKRIRKKRDDKCNYCQQTDSPEHTLFSCTRFRNERERCHQDIRVSLNPDNLTTCMLESPEKWSRITQLIEAIMKQKELDENRDI
ncbi:hypothetical protein M8J77_005918 [Diaphorina citri]|nr:hypothetical protein M8J77_005918 [Diaphorina citri]